MSQNLWVTVKWPAWPPGYCCVQNGLQFPFELGAVNQIVVRLQTIIAGQTQFVTDPECLGEQPGWMVGRSQIAYLSLARQIVERVEASIRERLAEKMETALFKKGKNVFHDPKATWELSDVALAYIAILTSLGYHAWWPVVSVVVLVVGPWLVGQAMKQRRRAR